MCVRCFADFEGLSIESLGGVTEEDLEQLPFGAVRIDEKGAILSFNQAEEARFRFKRAAVIGRSFFEDVAPCTSVRAFRGRFDELVEAGRSGQADLEFVFERPNESQLVRVLLSWDAVAREGLLLISSGLSGSADE